MTDQPDPDRTAKQEGARTALYVLAGALRDADNPAAAALAEKHAAGYWDDVPTGTVLRRGDEVTVDNGTRSVTGRVLVFGNLSGPLIVAIPPHHQAPDVDDTAPAVVPDPPGALRALWDVAEPVARYWAARDVDPAALTGEHAEAFTAALDILAGHLDTEHPRRPDGPGMCRYGAPVKFTERGRRVEFCTNRAGDRTFSWPIEGGRALRVPICDTHAEVLGILAHRVPLPDSMADPGDALEVLRNAPEILVAIGDHIAVQHTDLLNATRLERVASALLAARHHIPPAV